MFLLRYLLTMPTPPSERQSLEQELAESPDQLAAARQELENGRPHKARREQLLWIAENIERRLVYVRERLAALGSERNAT